MNRLVALLGACLCFLPLFNGYSQVSSVSDGDWSNTASWSCTCVPDFNSGTITIQPNHDITIGNPTPATIEADELVISGDASLTILSGSKLIIREGAGDDLVQDASNPPTTNNDGLLTIENGGILESRGQISSIASALIFEDGSEYQHNINGGYIPSATWQAGSICRITGWVGSSASSNFQGSLSQSFHHFIWDSPGQTQANVIFNGNLSTVNGNLEINNTNSGLRRITLGFTGASSGSISIGGDLKVANNSILALTSSGTYTVNVGGNVELASTATGLTYQLTSTGTATLNIANDLIVTSGQFHFTVSSGTGNVNLEGDFQLNGGSIHKTGAGNGNMLFTGSTTHVLTVGSGSFSANQPINYTIDSNDVLDLGTSAIGNSLSDPGSSGSFTNNGTVILGSAEPTGAIAGNIQIDTKTFNSGSTIIYGGLSAQFIGATHPATTGVITEINNASGVSLAAPITFGGDLTVQSGSALNLTADLSVAGNVNFETGSTVNPNTATLTMTGGNAQTLYGGGNALTNLTINKSASADVTLTNSLSITGALSVSSANSALISNGFLRLISTTDSNSGNARVAPLLNGASVDGDVIVERFMSNEGAIYRYLSSPIINATVAQLQDDFPVTGSFPQSSSCSGCGSGTSLYYYDAAAAQYNAFPTTNNSEQLGIGRGYAAYIYQNALPGAVTIDVTGPINQGPLSLPLSHNGSVAESWNLVGNPYPSTIDWDNATGWTKTNINGSIAVRDNPGGDSFRYWNGSVGSGIGTGLENGEIAAGQAFWIRTMAASPVLNINEQAKTSNTGAFYRSDEVHALAITVSKGILHDKTVIQIHDGAKREFDYYDAAKLVNGNFDLSTRLTTDQRFAINAINEINCGEEIIIDLRFTKNSNGKFVINPQGNYSMSFETLGDKFSAFNLILVDNFTKTNVEVTSGSTYDFSITADNASFADDRFKLIFEGDPGPDLNLEIEGFPSVCEDKEIDLIIHGAEHTTAYYLIRNGSIISDLKIGDGGDIPFKISGSALSAGNNEIHIGVKGVCNTMLINSWSISKDEVNIPEGISGQHCREGEVELSASGAGPNSTYQWYEEETSDDHIYSGEKFKTPLLTKTRTYFVSTTHAAGCESERIPVTAKIVNYSDAEISVLEGDVLSSNFETDNQWLFNNIAIEGATDPLLKAEKTGIYTLEVNIEGCINRAQLEYTVTSADEDIFSYFNAFPNPTSRELFIRLSDKGNGIETLVLINSLGVEVGVIPVHSSPEGKTGSFNVEHLANGIYFLKAILPGKTLIAKIIKE